MVASLDNQLYFSYWSWSILKSCPFRYKLRVLDKKTAVKTSVDAGRYIQGSIPHAQSEDFFKLPVNERNIGFFEDTFDEYWQRFLKDKSTKVDYAKYGITSEFAESLLKSRKITAIDNPPYGYESWEEYGYYVKMAETYNHSCNLAHLIYSNGLHTREVDQELPFRETVESGKQPLAVGGRIDLVFHAPANMVDIWDIKGVKKPNDLDDDQLAIYKMGAECKGFKVRTTGYILIKQCEMKQVNISVDDLKTLKSAMRDARKYADLNHYPAKYSKYTCRFCDEKEFCPTYQRQNRPFRQDLVSFRHGKVSFDE